GMEDSVALYVTETISWSPTGYQGSYVSAWEPCWDLYSLGSDDICDEMDDHGWEVTILYFKDESGDGGDHRCTLENLKRMKEGGIVAAHSHGNVGIFAVAYRDTPDLADAWWHKGDPDEEPHMATYPAREFPGHWRVEAEAEWFEDNWYVRLTESQAIVVVMACHSSDGGAASVAASCGGRVGFGYPACCDSDDHHFNCTFLFTRLNGSADGATKRTVGKAYGNGSEYEAYFEMVGAGDARKWTTINPAPNAAFPAVAVGGRKGAGCIIFDTYMDESQLPNLAVQKTAGGPVVSDRRWFANGSGRYLVSFDFESHAAGSVTMKGEADFCKNKNPATYGSTRKLSGDRQTYGEDKEWSF
ncbi:MAG TPA: hypothetical protein VM219_05245, partial [Phycisphaerae bacterium]|nr:hypothetical protein [Phycisphaerae bacterium]